MKTASLYGMVEKLNVQRQIPIASPLISSKMPFINIPMHATFCALENRLHLHHLINKSHLELVAAHLHELIPMDLPVLMSKVDIPSRLRMRKTKPRNVYLS